MVSKFISRTGIVLATLAPALAFAQENAGPETFVGSYTLWAAIIIGFIASILTLFYSAKMSGSTVGQSLRLLGLGMFVVVLGFLCVVVAWAPAHVQGIVHDLLFILGYFLMLMGISKIRKLSI